MGSFAAVVGSKKFAREEAIGWSVSLISEPLNPTKDTPAMTVSNETHLEHRLMDQSSI
jgi:hypothetical protein